MGRRADQVDETRRRIVEATVALHERIGLAATTVAAVAEEAGVTRLTVYRHFPEDADLFAACSAHWLASQRLPDPEAWARVGDPVERVRVGLADLYRHYRDGQAMLRHVRAELRVLPDELRGRIEGADQAYGAVLLGGFRPADRRPRLRAALGHAVSFWTWQSLCVDQGLSNSVAVDLMTGFVEAARNQVRQR